MNTPVPEETSGNDSPGRSHRPVMLSALCVFAWVSYGLMTLLFLSGLLYSGYLTEAFSQYTEPGDRPGIPLPALFLTGFILHASAFSGVFLIWHLRRAGYYLLAIPSLLFAGLHLFRVELSWPAILFYVLIIILFGLYYRKLH